MQEYGQGFADWDVTPTLFFKERFNFWCIGSRGYGPLLNAGNLPKSL